MASLAPPVRMVTFVTRIFHSGHVYTLAQLVPIGSEPSPILTDGQWLSCQCCNKSRWVETPR